MAAHRVRLNELFSLKWKRVPAHTTVRSILQGVNANELEEAFRGYSKALLETKPTSDALTAVAIDGKTLRGSFDHFNDQKAAQILSAFCHNEKLILAHLPISSKTNEIPIAR
uniref:DDE_Tnp_1-associated n=1 Tax=Candidatus Kentrum sp. LPFa TaxID=2126335 RepID=A0A450XMN9_9GAMM|nr:MAG: hypothetical protein BECKLPF1236A_GA0070988_108231 [Candidatus Kentron sp. LPFa]